jgi:hypothetical protein
MLHIYLFILADTPKPDIIKQAGEDYDIRLDWAGGLEILALILSSFTLFAQIVYLLFAYRNRMG